MHLLSGQLPSFIYEGLVASVPAQQCGTVAFALLCAACLLDEWGGQCAVRSCSLAVPVALQGWHRRSYFAHQVTSTLRGLCSDSWSRQTNYS